LASLLWRLRRATTMETGLFEIQADHLHEVRQARQSNPPSQEFAYALLGQANRISLDRVAAAQGIPGGRVGGSSSGPASVEPADNPTADLGRCFLRLANLPNFALDRLSRYEATLWRQVRQILFALDALDRRKPQERRRLSRFGCRQDLLTDGRDEC
jgi:hypothetical protein